MWFHLWLLFNGYESVSDLSWLLRQEGLVLSALLHNLTMDKMSFVIHTAANVPMQIHSFFAEGTEQRSRCHSLFMWRYQTSSVSMMIWSNPDALTISLTILPDTLRISYLGKATRVHNYFFFHSEVSAILFPVKTLHSQGHYSGNTWMDGFLLLTRFCSIYFFQSFVVCMARDSHAVNFQIPRIRKYGRFLQF